MHAIRDRFSTLSPETLPDAFAYRNLLKNEIFDSQIKQQFDFAETHQNQYEYDEDAKEDKYEFDVQCHYETNVRMQNSKYFEFNKGASPIAEKDKLSKTPSSTPTNDNKCKQTQSKQFDQSPKRFLTFSKETNDSYCPQISATPIRIDTQLKIQSFRYNGNSNEELKGDAYKVLDAPSIMDDFYSSVLDWNANSNLIGIALKDQLFAYNPNNHKITNLVSTTGGTNKTYFGETFSVYTNPLITSVQFIPSGSHLAVGTDCGVLSLWDIERTHCVLHINHNDNQHHIGTADWRDDQCIIYGSKLKNNINLADFRQSQCKPTQIIPTPTKSVSIKWSPDCTKFAIGGRDRCVSIYDARYLKSRVFKLRYHTSSIRAIEWSPHNHNILMSGGGALDKKICCWNLNAVNQHKMRNNYIDFNCITINKPIKCIRTESQVCDILWNPFRENEILSTHGFDTNDINLWNIDTCTKVKSFNGHSQRVLYVSKSPNGRDIVTGSNDETLRFWNVFSDTSNQREDERFDACEGFNIR